ncbi:MAG: HlyD family secretion protein [Paludibacter sp.]
MKTKMKFRKQLIFSFILLIGFISCKKSTNDFDAAGTFEATEVIVSSEAMGKILNFDIIEGQELTENQVVGNIDSVQLYLKKQQLTASRKALQNRKPDTNKQLAALEQQIATAKSELKRIQNLVNANAVNQKQLDDINAQIAVLEKQQIALKSSLELTSSSISDEDEAMKIQVKQIEDQLFKCRISSPIAGTVLTKYAEKGELASPGKALFKVADTQNIILRAYISSDQLNQIKIGQKVQVFSDSGEKESKQYEGKVSWIASKAEFTPKTIQTRDERANLVYAVKIAVKNDGLLKIGMYGNVRIINN